MGIFKRMWAGVKRQPKKYAIMFLLAFVLGSVSFGAVSVRQAILVTEENLRLQLPAVAKLSIDIDAVNRYAFQYRDPESSPFLHPSLTRESIHQIGKNERVQTTHYTTSAVVFSDVFSRYWNPRLECGEGEEGCDVDFSNNRLTGAHYETFTLQGVGSPELLHVEAGIMTFLQGRPMTEAEIENGDPVGIISKGFALENNLMLGDEMEFYSMVFDWRTWGEEIGDWDYRGTLFTDAFLLEKTDSIAIEIIGIIDFVAYDFEGGSLFPLGEDPFIFNSNVSSFENQLLVPNHLAESLALTFFELEYTHLGHEDWVMGRIDFGGIFFQLTDPADLRLFREEVAPYLPQFYKIRDLTNSFAGLLVAFDSMLLISDYVLWTTLVGSLCILTLLMILTVKERKGEIGIYLALGEKKAKLMLQFLLEAVLVTGLAVALSIIPGFISSELLSQRMLVNDLHRHQEYYGGDFWAQFMGDSHFALLSPGEMSIEEMLAAYQVSLDPTVIALFFMGVMLTVLASTFLPAVLLLRQDPKKIML